MPTDPTSFPVSPGSVPTVVAAPQQVSATGGITASFGPNAGRAVTPIRTTDRRSQFVLRDSVMKLLSDVEIAHVSTAEGGITLAAGDEYLDLAHLESGVLLGPTRGVMGRVLPRQAVGADTWTQLVNLVSGTGTDGNPAV